MTACKELTGRSDINDSPNRRDGCAVNGKLHFLFSNLRKQHADVDGGSRAGIAGRMFVAGVAGTGRAEFQQAQREDAKRVCGVRFARLADGSIEYDPDFDFQRLPDHRTERDNSR
ncbi:hypothetical protein D3C81_1543500 [compost metagenome]